MARQRVQKQGSSGWLDVREKCRKRVARNVADALNTRYWKMLCTGFLPSWDPNWGHREVSEMGGMCSMSERSPPAEHQIPATSLRNAQSSLAQAVLERERRTERESTTQQVAWKTENEHSLPIGQSHPFPGRVRQGAGGKP